MLIWQLQSLENGLITFGQKRNSSKTIHEIVNHSELEICFAEGNTVMNEQTIIQRKEMQSNRTVWCRKKTRSFLLDYKTGIHNAKYQQQLENYKAIELMGYKVIKKALIYIGKEIEVVNL
jgi:hypothetical protein